jgi:PAS domain S-box-containing protein
VTESSDPGVRDLDARAGRASEDSFRLIVETIPRLVSVMTPAGEVEHVNRQVLEYFGRTLEELSNGDRLMPFTLPICLR